MPNPVLSDKGFEKALDESQPGWAAPDTLTAGQAAAPPPATAERAMTANGTFLKAGVLFLFVLVGGAVGWSQVEPTAGNQVDIPGWIWIAPIGAFVVALVCIFSPRRTPFLAPLYALLEGVFLGAISHAFEVRWDGIVVQAILATFAVFVGTLALYVFGIVKVTRKFQMVVIGATIGVVGLYLFGALFSLFGVDVRFWNEPSALGIGVSILISAVAALNLFLDYEFIRQASVAGAPKFMEWFGAFGLMITLVWLYLELLRLLALLRGD